MNIQRRRSLPEILVDILASSPASRSGFRNTVGLNHTQAQRYLPYLITKGYLEGVEDPRGVIKYDVTPKGDELLRTLNELAHQLDEY